MKNKILLLMIVGQVALFAGVDAQSVAINTTGATANATAILDISSSTLGLLIPRMATAPTLTVAAPGLLFYNTTGSGFLNVNTSSTTTPNWIPLVSGATTNTLASSANTLTSTVNSVLATAAIINSVTNTYATNTISTTINGIVSTTPATIINSNVLSSSGATLISTINGATATAAVGSLDLTTAVTAIASSSSWLLAGNAITTAAPAPTTYGTTAATNSFLGTTSTQDLVLVANKVERLRIANGTGYVGIGTAVPLSTLDVTGAVGNTITSSATTIALGNGYVYYISGAVTVTLPSVVANRRYLIVNISGGNVTTSANYTNLLNAAVNTIPAHSSIEIIGNGTTWLQIK